MEGKPSLRVAHISMLGIPLSLSPGFKAQLESESRAADALRISSPVDWRTVLVAPAGNDEDFDGFSVPVVRIPRAYPGRIARRFYLWRYVRMSAKQNDVVLVRHSVVDPFETLHIRWLRNVAVVHHTKSAEELLATGHPVLAHVETWLLRLNRRWARWPVGVTAELARYARGVGCSADFDLVLPNGIELSSVEVARSTRRTGPGVHALFLASRFEPWHGLDRLIDALTQWRPRRGEQLTLHLVGRLSDAQIECANSVAGDWLDVQIHGTLSASEISELAGRIDIGIGSLALDRQGMADACTLKVREYLSVGIPVYSSHRDGGLPDGFPFYARVESIDIERLIDFALEMRSVDRREVRLAAERYISKEEIMRAAGAGFLSTIRNGVQ